MLTKSEMLAELNAIATDPGHPLAFDPDVGSAAAGASHAIYVRLSGDPNVLPDLDALKDARRYVVPQMAADGPDAEV